MSRTYKDKPYKVLEREAVEHGCMRQRVDYLTGRCETVADVDSYQRMFHRHARAYSRWHDWRDFENEWHPEYGNRTRVRDALHVAADAYNSGGADEDWDNPDVYQRRRAWKAA